MGSFFKNKYIISLFLATIICFLTMSIFDVSRPDISVVENVVGVVIFPVQKLFTTIGNWFGGFGAYFVDVNKYREENGKLKTEIQKLNSGARNLEVLEKENERLRKMLNLKEITHEFDLESAEIIGKNPGNWYNTFTIDKGTSSGIAKKQPVISAENALVGYISDVGTNWAKVVGVIDPASSVGAIIVRSRDIGIIEGDVSLTKEGYAKMGYISKNTNIIIGDYIETSGMGGIYPKGILIGQVLQIRPETYNISQYAIVEPAVDFDKISELFIIKNPIEEY